MQSDQQRETNTPMNMMWKDTAKEPWISNYYDLKAQDAMPEVTTSEIIELQDGDTYELILQDAKTEIAWAHVRVMTYNWSVPGPLLKVPQGASINLKVTNDIGDITSTVHNHGLRVDNKQDGVPVSMKWFDTPLNKGEFKIYRLEFPDVGVFRYHPHVREDLQQELGLYGNILVTPNDEKYRNTVDNEQVLIVDDIQMNNDWIVPFAMDTVDQTLMGRFGNRFLLNGSEDYTLYLTQGEVTRVYISNVANVRPFVLSFGEDIQMKLVWSDVGAYEKETMIERLLIAPAERYIVELYPSKDGTFPILYSTPLFSETIWTVVVKNNDTPSLASQTFTNLRQVEAISQDIDQYRSYFDKEVDKTLRFDVDTGMMMNMKGWGMMMHDRKDTLTSDSVKLWWVSYDLANIERKDDMPMMNMRSTDKNTTWKLIDEDTKKSNMDINDWVFQQWDIVKVRLINDAEGQHPMQHPIHFHGQRFLVLEKNWVRNDNLVWKDTVLTTPGDTIDILIDMSNPWTWLAHCHISEHMHAGMMFSFEVGERKVE